MKILLALCVMLGLAGCNSKPSGGDIERALAPSFTSCHNIKLDGAEKTNGFGEPDAYHLSYRFTLKVDSDKLDELGKIYARESAAYAKLSTEYAAFNKESDDLKREIANLQHQFYDSTPRPRNRDFAGPNGLLTDHQEAAYEAAERDWSDKMSALIERPKAELAKLEANWYDTHAAPEQRTFRDPNHISEEMGKFYVEGCPYQVVRQIGGIFNGVANQADLFKRTKIDLQAEMTMHKTEQGWQPVD